MLSFRIRDVRFSLVFSVAWFTALSLVQFGAAAGVEPSLGAAAKPKASHGVNFIRSLEDIPPFAIPPYRGTRYEAMVPDTLDIQERAALAINGLTGPTDPDRDYLLYFYANFSANPPAMNHSKSDICQVKFMESLPLMRLICGSELHSEVDKVWMASALRMIGPDGLVYWPSFPWGPVPDWAEDGPGPEGTQYSVPFIDGRAIGAMTVYMLRDPQGPWRKEIQRAVAALDKLAIHKGDYAYFPQGGFTPGGNRPLDAEIPVGIGSSLAGWTTQGLAQFARASAEPLAGQLSGELSRYLRYHGFWYGADGSFLPNYPFGATLLTEHKEGVHPYKQNTFYRDHPYIHFQHHIIPLLGLLDAALAAGDRDQAEFVRKSFEWAKTKGETTVGYFPENINSSEAETAETCQLAGMIGVALKLSEAGVGDYWDDADRWIRNQFAENQLRRSDWVYRVSQGPAVLTRRRLPLSEVTDGQSTTDHVPERNIGAFAGWPSANDFYTGHGAGIQQCCTGNGTRALYYVWEHMITFLNGELRVNLLLNRPSRWADILSYIPYQGEVEIRIKESCRLKVRIPQWVQPAEAMCTVDGKAQALTWDGRYAVVGEVTPRQVVHLSFPIHERIVEVDIEKQHYILTIKGNDVVNIDPPGRYGPLYQRDYYRENAVRWKKAERFVSDETLVW